MEEIASSEYFCKRILYKLPKKIGMLHYYAAPKVKKLTKFKIINNYQVLSLLIR